MAGKLEFTQFHPLVAEKHSGLQQLKCEGNSIKRVENELNWIKSLTKSDIIGIWIGCRISISDIIAIGQRFRNQNKGYRYHIVRAAQRIPRFTLQSKGFCQSLFVFLPLGLVPAMFFLRHV